jgi:lipoyl(octanoyl) transferase
MDQPQLHVIHWGRQDYQAMLTRMHEYTNNRTDQTQDQLWVVEHNPVFSQGQAGKPEHLLSLGDIPLVQSDRGGQVTYHGPGQLVVYLMLDLRRRKLGVRDLVTAMENALIQTLAPYSIEAYAKADAPGVYVFDQKIASLGLRIRKGCSFHGLALNVAMDMSPFLRINPCGYAGLEMTQTSAIGGPADLKEASSLVLNALAAQLNSTITKFIEEPDLL